jgi:hypothetical protein
MKKASFLIVSAVVLQTHSAFAAISFVLGDYYTSNYSSRTITQYNSAGNPVGSLELSASLGSGVRGLAFGADNLLYATVVTSSGFSVLALDSAGTPQQTYSGDVYVGGNLGYGKIAMDSEYLYVAGQNNLTRFLLGDPTSGTPIYSNNQVFDVKPLPNGNLFVASAYEVEEITTDGTLVREIPLVGNFYTDIRGIEYNPSTDDLFVTHLGHTDFSFRIMRVNASTGVLEDETTFVYADDLFLTLSGRLLVGSYTQVPRFYNQELEQVGTLGTAQQMFVTQLIPEPSAVALCLAGTAILLFARHSTAT